MNQWINERKCLINNFILIKNNATLVFITTYEYIFICCYLYNTFQKKSVGSLMTDNAVYMLVCFKSVYNIKIFVLY